MTSTETPPVFTDVSWDDFKGTGLTRENTRGIGWMRQHDLAVEAWNTTREFCPLDHQQIETLISAVGNGLPVIIRHRNHNGETTTATYIVKQFLGYRPGTTMNLYVQRWGFAHPLSLREIVSVEAPRAEYSFKVDDD